MVSFVSDYTTGAHPEVLAKLAETNLEPLPGYGADPYCESAKEKIRAACGLPEAEVFFLTGGTQTNAVVISTMLKDWEGVIAAKTGHVSVHEAGAIEHTGHEVLEVEQADGKIQPETLRAYLAAYYADESHEHMTFPGMVYVSHFSSNWRSWSAYRARVLLSLFLLRLMNSMTICPTASKRS